MKQTFPSFQTQIFRIISKKTCVPGSVLYTLNMSVIKTILVFSLLMVLSGGARAFSTQTIQSMMDSTAPTLKENQPAFANFYSAKIYEATGDFGPPAPGNPLGLAAWPLDADGTKWLLDDLNVPTPTPSKSTSITTLSTTIPMPGDLPVDGGVGGGQSNTGSMTSDYPPIDPAGLWLEILATTNDGASLTAFLTIHPPATNQDGIYGIYLSTNLLDPTDWTWLGRSEIRQTNLVITNLPIDNAFFRLGPPNAIRPGFTNYALFVGGEDAQEEDTDSALADIGFPINYFGVVKSNLFVNQNGNVTFDTGFSRFKPFDFYDDDYILHCTFIQYDAFTNDIIAPFWADVDPRAFGIPVTYGTHIVEGQAAFGVDWVNVGYFTNNPPYYDCPYETDKTNSFQLVIISRPDRAEGDYDIEFNYSQIQWDVGSASTDGGGNFLPAIIGFDSLDNEPYQVFQLTGSGVKGYFFDTNPDGTPNPTGLIYSNFNSTVPGRYVIQFHNGEPMALPPPGTINYISPELSSQVIMLTPSVKSKSN